MAKGRQSTIFKRTMAQIDPALRRVGFPCYRARDAEPMAALLAAVWLFFPGLAAAEEPGTDSGTEADSRHGFVGPAARTGPPGIALEAPRSRTAALQPAESGRAGRVPADNRNQSDNKRSARRLSRPRWIRHRVIDCENLSEIAARYEVPVSRIAKWNDLKGKNPVIRSGQRLLVRTRFDPPKSESRMYTVRSGDGWNKIANRFKVDTKSLRCWNRSAPRHLRPGGKLFVWVDLARMEGGKQGDASLQLKAVRRSGVSVGRPDRGRLLNGVQLPENPELYRRRNPRNSWGSSHAVEMLQVGVARFRRDTGFAGELVICDMSRRRGGRFPPHSSHRSGRDVDIRLPLASGVARGTVPNLVSQVDWDAVWGLVKALVSTGQVKYIFLSRSRQRFLHRAAKRAGATDGELTTLIQYPRRERAAIVRSDPGHIHHIHVRFLCAEHEDRCRD